MSDIEHAEGEGWLTHSFECAICGYMQVHVIPLPCMFIDCSKCGIPQEVYAKEGATDE